MTVDPDGTRALSAKRPISLPAICLALLCAVAAHGARAQDLSTLIAEANILYTEGQFAAARDTYADALAVDPDDARALNNRGLAHVALGDLEAARRDLTAALDAAPQDGTIWNNRANVNCALKRYEDSLVDRIRALQLGRFTIGQAQGSLRKQGFYKGFNDGIWGYESEIALSDWTRAGCPSPPASRLL